MTPIHDDLSEDVPGLRDLERLYGEMFAFGGRRPNDSKSPLSTNADYLEPRHSIRFISLSSHT